MTQEDDTSQDTAHVWMREKDPQTPQAWRALNKHLLIKEIKDHVHFLLYVQVLKNCLIWRHFKEPLSKYAYA